MSWRIVHVEAVSVTHLMEVKAPDIERLPAGDLTDLLRRLVKLDLTFEQVPLSSYDVPLNIDTPDGGEDGCVDWQGPPDRTNWIPHRLTMFQCKATAMEPADCKKELFRKKTRVLKPRVETVLDAGGAYILFYGRSCSNQMRQDRIARIREGLMEAGKQYADTAIVDVYDANKIAEWVNMYDAARVYVCSRVGRHLPAGIATWNRWKREWDNDFQYRSDKSLVQHMTTLREALAHPTGAVVRVIGLSGLGKSRLVFESLRPSSQGDALSDQTVYIRADEMGTPRELPAYVDEWVTNDLRGILVVDNCDPDLHQRLARVVRSSGGRFSLVSMDFDPGKPKDCPFIELKPVSDEVIIGILQQGYPTLPEGDIKHVAQFAQGFPQMAVLLANACLNDQSTIGRLDDDQLLNRLLWIREPRDEVAYQVISILSLFEYVGFEGSNSGDRAFLAAHFNISPADFYRHTMRFWRQGIVEKKGDFMRVTPLPLAVRLASDWWTDNPPELVDAFIGALPPNMLEPLGKQVRKLSFHPRAQEFVARLCGTDAPFGRAEVLNSERGSQLFCSLVEVNPQATTKALGRVFGAVSREELLQVQSGRRNLVWALERLCFWPDTFPVAARVLLALASAENETWSNNATGQFLQLFHIWLSGTQAHPDERIAIVDEALRSDEPERRIIAIRALGEALEAFSFSRAGGVEAQGTRPPSEDWKPKRWGDIFDYWRLALARLTRIATGVGEEAKLARDKIAESIRGLTQYGRINELGQALSRVVEKHGNLWPKALEQLQAALHYEGPQLPDEGKAWVREWITRLQPESIPDRLRLYISVPPFHDVEKEEGKWVDLALKKAEALAEELAGLGTSWYQFLPIIFEGEQRKGYGFGQRLAKVVGDPDAFVDEALRVLQQAPKEKANPEVLAGFLKAMRGSAPAFVDQVMERVRNDDALSSYLVDLSRLALPTATDLHRVTGLVAEGKVPVTRLDRYSYGSVLDALPVDVVVSFCDEMLRYGVEGNAVALHVLYMYCYGEPDRQAQCRSEFRKIVMLRGLLGHSTMEDYAWQETVVALLQTEERDPELAVHIATQVVEVSGAVDAKYGLDHALASVLRSILSRYSDEVWPVFSRALHSKNPRVYLHLTHLLGHPSPDRGQSLILSVPSGTLLKWCETDKGAADVLARIIPLFASDESGDGENTSKQWTPLALELISRYGQRSGVLSSIRANMGTGVWWGSLVPRLESDVSALEQLANHSLPEVRRWVRETVARIREEIVREKRREEEEELGIR